MICYFIYCSGCQEVHKSNQLRVQALNIYCSDLFSTVIEDLVGEFLSIPYSVAFLETGNYLYAARILPNPQAFNLCAASTNS